MSETRLGRDVYLALAAVGWADGQLDPEEADAIVRTAVEEGLSLEVIAEIEAATKKPLDIGIIDRSSMTKEDRLFVYAVASWMTRLDGLVTDTELTALKGGDLGGAAIDVLPQEPPAKGSVLFEPGIPNLLVTPHIAWAAFEARQAAA